MNFNNCTILKHSIINDIQERIKEKRVLDVGCCGKAGDKSNLKHHKLFSKTAKEIVGVDINKKAIKDGKNKGITNIYHLDVSTFDQNCIKDFINVHNQFDVVILRDVIEHVGNLTQFLDNINRFLFSNGVLYITTPNMGNLHYVYEFHKMNHSRGADHICCFDVKHLKELLGRSGFKINDIMYSMDKVIPEIAKKMNLQLYCWMGKDLYIIAEKVEEKEL
jgi:2-polyprenyl-3-methyl-5-hydroxy-6-metoxy-1,4-benzoquinol methylase